MIVKRVWSKRKHAYYYTYEGWFLLGFIPLYIRVIDRY
jgi:hypothetical protein